MIKRLFNAVRFRLFPTELQRTIARWYADGGDIAMRYDYDLTSDSVVLDLGGYDGQWSSDIFSRYACRIFVFEPVASFAQGIEKRFARNPRITVLPFALGSFSQKAKISVSGVGSSLFRDSGDKEEIEVVDVATWFSTQNITRVDLMKINIEGAEYALLERLIGAGLIQMVVNLQVQFHHISDDSEPRMTQIQASLSDTHRPTYQYRFLWESWARKEIGTSITNAPPRNESDCQSSDD